MKDGGIYIGTSGWSYKSWAGNFYPSDLPASKQLKFYMTRFPNYTDRELRPWAKFLRGCAKEGLTGFVYFDNDMNTRAPLNALRLMELVGPSAVQTCPVHNFSRRRVEKSEAHMHAGSPRFWLAPVSLLPFSFPLSGQEEELARRSRWSRSNLILLKHGLKPASSD